MLWVTKIYGGVFVLKFYKGSLTNLALALQMESNIIDWVDVHMMGGAFSCVGNRSPLGEANMVDDPEAAKMVLTSKWKIVMSPLNVTRQIKMNHQYLQEISKLNKIGEL